MLKWQSELRISQANYFISTPVLESAEYLCKSVHIQYIIIKWINKNLRITQVLGHQNINFLIDLNVRTSQKLAGKNHKRSRLDIRFRVEENKLSH